MKKVFPIFLLLLFLSFQVSLSQNKIDRSKKELKAAKEEPETKKRTTADDRKEMPLVGKVFMYITWGVFKYVVIGDYNSEEHLENYVNRHPFQEQTLGNYTALKKERNFQFLVSENLLYSNSNLFANRLTLQYRPFSHFYFKTDFHQLFERNPIYHTQDQLSLFQFNLMYDRIRFQEFNFGWNIGLTYIGNDIKQAGLSLGIHFDTFLIKNISFSGDLNWSSMNSIPVNTYTFKGNYHFRKNVCSFGFEHLKIGTPQYNFVTLGIGHYF